jgi:DNA-binding response OmpR family regulator
MKKILIIEDEKILSEMYQFKLEKEGYETMNAMYVDEAIEIANKNNPDLVILDILLPKESGINYLVKSKKFDNIKNIPVLVISNFDDNETKEKCFELGIRDYLIKSNYDPKEVVCRIKKILES